MKRFSAAVFLFLFCTTTQAANIVSSPMVLVDVSEQKLYLLEGGKILKTYPVSTSKFGVGNRQNSGKTPLGWHRVAKKIGAGAALNTIFRNRINTGKFFISAASGDDLVTTRILWLEGMEPGVNKGKRIDSFKRLIYIHGTAEENLIGTPASHGCIRMKNKDVVELFDKLQEKSSVLIRA